MSKKQTWITITVFLLYTLLVWVLCWLLLRESSWIPIGLVFTACGFTIAVVYWLVARMGAHAGKPAGEAAPAKSAAPAAAKVDTTASDADTRAVQALLKEADTQLANSPLLASERVRPKLADLPLYILAGTAGSGKTSNLLHGGLSPVALAGQVHRGGSVIPTQVANLWFARRALVAEPSGACFSEDGGRWTGFLHAVRGSKSSSFFKSLWQAPPKDNLHGIVLFVDAGAFVGIPDSTRLTNLARTVQDRLRSAAAIYSSDIPVWVVFSKADSIPFFRDYFEHLTDTEDQQPLGCTLEMLSAHQRPSVELYAEAETQRLNNGFDLLYRSLGQHRLPFLGRESGMSAKRGIYEFPRELKRIRGTIVQFLVEVFRPNELQPGPLLRGFYMTGTRQVADGSGPGPQASASGNSGEATIWMQGSSLAQMEQQAARGAAGPQGGGPRERTVDRWSFVSQLLHQVIRPGQSGVRQYGSQRSVLYRKLAFGTVMGLSALLVMGVLWSAWNNRQLLARIEKAGIDLQGAPISARDFSRRGMTDLDTLRERLVELNTWESSRPWGLRFFLYQGDAIADRARQVYLRYFNAQLLDPILKGYTGEFASLPARQADEFPYDTTYDHVKTYVTVTSQECPATAPLADSLMTGWKTWNLTGGDQGDLVRRQFDFYVGELSRQRVAKLAMQKPAVQQGRDYLGSFSEEQRLYSSYVEQVSQAVPAARLADYAPKYGEVLADVHDIPGAFTRSGWGDMLERIAAAQPTQESCVLGKSKLDSGLDQVKSLASNGPSLSEQLKNHYLADYASRWQAMLTAVQVKPYDDHRDAARKLGTMDSDLTLLGLMFMTRENTEAARISKGNAAASKISELAKGELTKKIESSNTGRLAKKVADAAASDTPAPTVAPDPAEVFQPVTVMFSPDSSRRKFTDPKNDAYMTAINKLKRAMSDLADSSDKGDKALNIAAKTAADDGADVVLNIGHQFNRDALVVSDQVSRLLNSPFQASRGLFSVNFEKATSDKLNGAGGKFCQDIQPLLKKFPFKTEGSAATIDEVSRVFNPDTGSLAQFYQATLAQILSKVQGRYEVKASVPPEVKISPEFLSAFNRLMRITDALFPERSASPSMTYRLSVQQNPDVNSISLVVDGQQALQDPVTFTWPRGGSQGLALTAHKGTAEIPIETVGGPSAPWAIFALMADADRHNPGSREITITNIQGGAHSQPGPIIIDGKPLVVHLKVDAFPNGVDSAFDKDFFSGVRCVPAVAGK